MGKKSKNKKDFSALLEMTAFLLIALFFCIALSSCKKKKEQKLSTHTELSQKVEDLQKNAAWAYEIESERLSKKISSVDSIAKKIPLAPAAMIALEAGSKFPAIFPELAGFTNLDTTNIQGEVLDITTNFCSALVEYTAPPAPPEKNEEDENTEENTEEVSEVQKDSSKIDEFFNRQTLYSLALFLADSEDAGPIKSFVIGQPFVGEEQIEVPIRFTCEGKILYTMVYPVSSGNTWKIHQIEIYKEE